ncbi:hypothetical protein D3C86_1602380 [compost metagenome]
MPASVLNCYTPVLRVCVNMLLSWLACSPRKAASRCANLSTKSSGALMPTATWQKWLEPKVARLFSQTCMVR